MIKIRPKDKSLLDDPKVKEWYKKVDEKVGDIFNEAMKAAGDAVILGTGVLKMGEDGIVVRVSPETFFVEEKPLTTGDISKHLHVHLRTVLQWIKEGKLKAYRTPGRHCRVHH